MTPSERLAPFVTNLDRPVYALKGLPPEVVAVLFAQVSRSPAGFRENLLHLMEQDGLPAPAGAGFDHARASAFHEKWVLGYGHSSVAEHAPLHFAVEGLSILAAKALEDARLVSFTEKSSRYQVFDAGRFHEPVEWRNRPWRDEAVTLVGELFAAYADLYRDVRDELEGIGERPEGLGERGWRQLLHAQACDVARYLLPAGAMTSLGLSGNARSVAHLIRKLRSHELAELRALGDQLETEGRQAVPVLLKHAAPSGWQAALAGRLEAGLAGDAPEPGDAPRVRLLEWDADGAQRVVAAWLVQVHGGGWADAMERASALGPAGRARVLATALEGLGPHDDLPRAFEQVGLLVEFCLDYGAFRDLQRHRMLTPIVPRLGCRWGYELPPDLHGRRRARAEELLAKVAVLWKRIAEEDEAAAAYLVPLAFRQRFTWRLNLRQAEHLIHQRSAAAGHASYRSAAQDLHARLVQALPELAPCLRVDSSDAPWTRAGELQRQGE